MALIRQNETFKKLIAHGFAERLALAYMRQDPEQARLAVAEIEIETEKRDKKTARQPRNPASPPGPKT